jgi:FAD:protein FMN transferase
MSSTGRSKPAGEPANSRPSPFKTPDGQRGRRGMTRKVVIAAVGIVLILLLGLICRDLSRSGPAEVDSGSRIVMGTFSRAVVIAPDARVARECVEDAFEVQRQIENLMSYQREDSELGRVNREACDGPVVVSRMMFEVLQKSVEFSRLSDGAFDVTVGPLMDLWKAAGEVNAPPTEAALAEARARVGYEKLILNEKNGSVRFAVKGMKIDLGGIGKGYAVDKSVEAMKTRGAVGGMVDLGGNVRCFGQPLRGRKAWRIGLQDPNVDPDEMDDSRILLVLTLTERSVATSGGYRRFVEVQGTKQSHIMDPSNGKGASKLASDTIIAPDATTADALSTAVNVLGTERGLALVERLPGVEAILLPVDPTAKLLFSTGAKAYVE